MISTPLMCITCALVTTLTLSEVVRAQPAEIASDTRARAWATIARIHDDSIYSVAFRDTVRVHFDDGSDVVMYQYDVRADDLRNVRVVGRWCHMDPAVGPQTYGCQPVEYSQTEGIVRAQNRHPDRPSVIARFEQPDRVDPWSVPSVLKGLGHAPVVHDIRTRTEQLLECTDLAIEQENSRTVVLTGRDAYYRNHPYRVRVEIDAMTGRLVRYQLIDAVWDCLVTDWLTVEREDFDGVLVPGRVEYRMYDVAISDEHRQRLRDLCLLADIPPDAMHPDHSRFQEWVRIRTDVIGGPVPTRLAAPWQSSTADIIEVNWLHDKSWYELDILPNARFLSAPLECFVTGPHPVPLDLNYSSTTNSGG